MAGFEQSLTTYDTSSGTESRSQASEHPMREEPASEQSSKEKDKPTDILSLLGFPPTRCWFFDDEMPDLAMLAVGLVDPEGNADASSFAALARGRNLAISVSDRRPRAEGSANAPEPDGWCYATLDEMADSSGRPYSFRFRTGENGRRVIEGDGDRGSGWFLDGDLINRRRSAAGLPTLLEGWRNRGARNNVPTHP